MLEKELEFIPLLLGNDINVYSVARAFHEEYGIISYAYGKAASGPCCDSKIIKYTVEPKMDTTDTFLRIVDEFVKKYKNKSIIVLGCGDSYVKVIAMNKDKLPANVIAPYIDFETIERITNKEEFYKICEANNISYPKTFVYKNEMNLEFSLPFQEPYILKPADGVLYYRHKFESQKKVFKVKSFEELKGILKDVYASGYTGEMIIQEFVPGDDTNMRVLTNYSGADGKVKFMLLGHVLLEEHTPHGIGNHAAIINTVNEDLCNTFKKLLEDMNYVGFSNFDIKYDSRDGKYKAFEINVRQGRSNFYVTGSGYNIAKMVVDEYIYKKETKFSIGSNEHLWLVIPKSIVLKYVNEVKLKKQVKNMFSTKKYVNPLFYNKDMGFIKLLKLWKSQIGHFFKYKKYLGGGQW